MFFMSLAIWAPLQIFAPWWSVPLVAVLIGFSFLWSMRAIIQCGLAAGLSHAMLAFYFDGFHRGGVSERLAGLFQMPWPEVVYLLVGAISLVSVVLGVSVGESLRPMIMRR